MVVRVLWEHVVRVRFSAPRKEVTVFLTDKSLSDWPKTIRRLLEQKRWAKISKTIR